MIRLFVALALPDGLRRRMTMLAAGVREARWVEPGNLHLTLRFIGETQEDRVDDIGRALNGVRAEAFDLAFSGVGHFESRKRVRALWVGVDANPALTALQARVGSALMRAGCAPDARRFQPHVTLARLKAAPPSHVGGWLDANSLFRAGPLSVTDFTLFESHLGRGGAHYRPLGEFPLVQGGAEG